MFCLLVSLHVLFGGLAKNIYIFLYKIRIIQL
jgi:hypothetical protein